jgi:flagellar biogenesis protein FliO
VKTWRAMVFLLAVVLGAPALPALGADAVGASGAATRASTQIESQTIHRDGTPGEANLATKGAASPDSQLNSLNPTRVLVALGAVILLILILRWCVKKLIPGAVVHRSTSAMKVLSRCAISPKQRLLLVQIGKRLVVVGDAGAQLNPLCQITDSEEVSALLAQVREESSSIASRFDSIFGRAKKGFEGEDEEAKEQASGEEEVEHSEISATRDELAGLSDKVRGLAKQLGRA